MPRSPKDGRGFILKTGVMVLLDLFHVPIDQIVELNGWEFSHVFRSILKRMNFQNERMMIFIFYFK